MIPYSLYELNALARKSLSEKMPGEYWVQAELSEVRINPSGHCYLEFIQKDGHGNSLLAKARGTVWANIFRLLKPYFERETGQEFTSGLKVLVKVSVAFHELYGYSLAVLDIDPAYTLGDMVRRRKEILRQLAHEGVLELNKELELPALVQRIAVISSHTAAGYGDFCDQLNSNKYGLRFYTRLFPAVMQGNKVEQSIISALDAINAERDLWDVVVIIRGGGSTSDLSGFDTYELAANCAQFPLPLITGIGHERDQTVIDMVAHTRVKTPTAAAEFLIHNLWHAFDAVSTCALEIARCTSRLIEREQLRLQAIAGRVPVLLRMRGLHEEHKIKSLADRLRTAAQSRLMQDVHSLNVLKQRLENTVGKILFVEKHTLELAQKQVENASPEHLFKRGYSITLKGGKAVTRKEQVRPGDEIETVLLNGRIKSKVEK